MRTNSVILWDRWQSAILLMCWAVAYPMNFWPLLYWAVVLSFLCFGLIHYRDWMRFRPWFGYANMVTGLRLLVILLLAAYFEHLADWQIALTGITVVILDGVDGWLARRFVQESYIGAYFDMETDVVYVLAFSTILFLTGKVGDWIFFPALLRYFYVLIGWLLHLKEESAKGEKWARWIAGSYFGALLFPFILPLWLAEILLGIAAAGVSLSFLRSFLALKR